MKKTITSFMLILLIVSMVLISNGYGNEADSESDMMSRTELQELVEELEERLDELEKKSASDRIQLTGELRVMHHNTYFKSEDSDANKDRTYFNQIRFRMSMRTPLVNRFRFVGRATTYKNWGVALDRRDTGTEGSGYPSDSTIRLERAYVDYFFSENYSFSFGRLPASEGPPHELKEETTQKSTYPQALYGIELDGVVAVAQLPDFSVFDPAFRIIYGEFSNIRDDAQFVDSKNKHLTATVFQLDSRLDLPNSEGLIVLDFMKVSNLEAGQPQYIKEIEHDLKQTTGEAYEEDKSVDSQGEFYSRLLHFQIEHILGSSFTAYANYAQTRLILYNSKSVFRPEDPDSEAEPICMIGEVIVDCEYTTEDTKYDGYAINTGLMYRFGKEMDLRPMLGAEWHYGSRYYYGLENQSPYRDNNMLMSNTIGTATHLFWIQPFEKNLFLRVGRYEIRSRGLQDEFSLDIGPIHRSLIDYYVLLNARF